MVRREEITIKSLLGEVLARFIIEANPITDESPKTPPMTEKDIGTGNYATDSQIRALYAIARRVQGLTKNPDIREHICETFKVSSPGEVPFDAARSYIEANQAP